jgi:hypothetical protein
VSKRPDAIERAARHHQAYRCAVAGLSTRTGRTAVSLSHRPRVLAAIEEARRRAPYAD